MRPDEVPALFTAARFLWLDDRALRVESVEDEAKKARAWGNVLADFSVDECAAAMESMVKRGQDRFPTLAALLSEARSIRARTATPVLEPPPAAEPTAGQKFLRESQKRRDQYTDELVEARTKLATHGGIPPDADEVAEFRRWAAEIGPIEAKWLSEHGVVVPETASKVLEMHGNLAEAMYGPGLPAEPHELAPKSTEELAQEFAVRWRGARTARARTALKAEGQSFTPEMREAVKAALAVTA